MPMTARQRLVLQQTLIVEVWKGSDGYGKPSYISPHTFACRITEEPEYVRRLGDPSINANSMIWMDVQTTENPPVLMSTLITQAQGSIGQPATMLQILAQTRVTSVDGAQLTVHRFVAEYDPHGIHHFVIFAG